MLAGQHRAGDYKKASESYRLLGAHFEQTQIDKHFHLLLPTSNSQGTLEPSEDFRAELSSYNSASVNGYLPPVSLPTGKAYTDALDELREKGMSASFYSAADIFSLVSRAMGDGQAANTTPAHAANAIFYGKAALLRVNDCFISKKDVCSALEAIAGVGASLAFPSFVLCTVGGLAALIGLVIATEGLAGPEAAELLAEGEEVCQALSSKTLDGITYVVGALQIGLRC